jgi:hypothetical protein
MSYTAGQQVRIKANGETGKIFLKLPLRDVYLVQFTGFPVVEKIYNGCDLELVSPVEAWFQQQPEKPPDQCLTG